MRPLPSYGELPQSGIDLVEHRGTRAQLPLRERVERRLGRVEMLMQIFCLTVEVEDARHDLTLGGMLLEETHRRHTVVHVVVGINLAHRHPSAVLLLTLL